MKLFKIDEHFQGFFIYKDTRSVYSKIYDTSLEMEKELVGNMLTAFNAFIKEVTNSNIKYIKIDTGYFVFEAGFAILTKVFNKEVQEFFQAIRDHFFEKYGKFLEEDLVHQESLFEPFEEWLHKIIEQSKKKKTTKKRSRYLTKNIYFESGTRNKIKTKNGLKRITSKNSIDENTKTLSKKQKNSMIVTLGIVAILFVFPFIMTYFTLFDMNDSYQQPTLDVQSPEFLFHTLNETTEEKILYNDTININDSVG